ncbi:hypothetical protein [Draconibacterium sediminis]|uniref:hypothetical protein n=1 Tax=Draconibacterium sediminis TaxID=1544798 RepID=UPI0026F09008|nr:hypothetical protein [Draconibacterium sediminis]
MAETTQIVKFNLFDFLFTPKVENERTDDSKSILKKCIDRINYEYTTTQKAIVVDRNEGRKDEESRNLFVRIGAYSHRDKKYKCRIFLIRDAKLPTLVDKSNFRLTPLSLLGNHVIAETTHFYIDMNGKDPIVCCEFNNLGPRISDIEYYFRQISSYQMLGISKACKAQIHMKMPIDDVLESMSDVLKFRIKSRPNRLKYLSSEVDDSFITNMNGLAGSVAPRVIRIDAFFRERGKSNKTKKKNNLAISFTKKVLNALKDDNKVADDIDDFYLEFEREDGSDSVFSLLNGKEEIIVEVQQGSQGIIDSKKLYQSVKVEFENYLNERNS